MKKIILPSLLLLVSLGCTKENLTVTQDKPKKEIITVESDEKESSSVRAQKYVQQAEKLMSPNGFMYAYQVLEKAYELDSTNFKVQFYLRLLKPLVLYKGFYLRIQPVLEQLTPRERDEFTIQFMSIPTGSLQSFLLAEGGTPFKTEEDIQKFALKVDAALKEFRLFLKKEKSRIATINVVGTTNMQAYLRKCSVTRLSEKSFQVDACPYAYQAPFTLDSGDFEALQQMSAGMQMMIKTMNSYNLNGLVDVKSKNSKKYQDIETQYGFDYGYGYYEIGSSQYVKVYRHELVEEDAEYLADDEDYQEELRRYKSNLRQASNMTEEQLIKAIIDSQELMYSSNYSYINPNEAWQEAYFKKHKNLKGDTYLVSKSDFSILDPNRLGQKKDLANRFRAKARLGKLKERHYLNFFKEFGPELIAAYKWANKYQDYLCPEGKIDIGNRPDRLFRYGFCVNFRSSKNAYMVSELFNLFELNLTGKNINVSQIKREGVIVTKEMNPAAFFTNPITDLKSIVPYYNDCDQAIKIDDPTFGGIFPKGDGLSKPEKACE